MNFYGFGLMQGVNYLVPNLYITLFIITRDFNCYHRNMEMRYLHSREKNLNLFYITKNRYC